MVEELEECEGHGNFSDISKQKVGKKYLT